MRAILKTNDPVLLSFAQSLLGEADIESFVFDENASVMDGSLGILPRRLMVADADHEHGIKVLKEGLAPPKPQVTEDRFLGGRLTLRQLAGGFRAGLDAVMLAAAVPARDGDEVLELGSGAGHGEPVPGGTRGGRARRRRRDRKRAGDAVERQCRANGMGERVVFVTVDALSLPADMKRDYAHVMCNPPFHTQDGARSPDAMKAGATHDDGSLAEWLNVGARRTARAAASPASCAPTGWPRR
ncbi:MAG: DUF2007 domain-containing protein [Rhizomicrobium sp.]